MDSSAGQSSTMPSEFAEVADKLTVEAFAEIEVVARQLAGMGIGGLVESEGFIINTAT